MTSVSLKIPAYAKINWSLDILGQRGDGYHLMSMIMQQVTLCDHVEIRPADTLSLTLRIPGIGNLPLGEDNLMMRAARLLAGRTGVRAGAAMFLTKYIPIQAGLGGGSADAAAVLHGLNALWNTRLDPETLERLGLELGADVPFCLRGGLCRVEGIGEKVTSLPERLQRRWPLILMQPCEGLSTGAVFRAWHAADAPVPVDTEGLLNAMEAGDPALLPRTPGNALEPVSRSMRPEIEKAVGLLFDRGAVCAQMSGSGPSVYGVFRDEKERNRALAAIRLTYPNASACETLGSKELVLFD